MSYSDRLTVSSAMKPKQPNINGESKASSSSSSSAVAAAPTTNPSAHGSKSLMSRVPPGLPKAPTKSKSKSPGPSIIARKRASSTNPAKKYSSPPLTPSDDLTSAVILRKKNPSKNTVVLSSSNNISCATIKTSPKETSIVTPLFVVKLEKADERKKLGLNRFTKVASAAKGLVVHEGPVELPEENFDFYRILARPKVWEEDEDYVTVKSSELAKDRVSRKVKASPSYTVKRKESEIWGSMRTSTPGESSIPSLTSIVDEESKDCKKVLVGSLHGGEIRRDENNNVLTTITNTIFGSLNLFDASRNEDNGGNNAANDDDAGIKSQLSHPSSIRETGQVKEQGWSKEKINVQSTHNNNIYNSVPQSLTPPDGQMQSLEKSVLIPKKIEEQLHQEFHVDTSPCLENHSGCLTRSQKSEENPLTKISPFNKINPTGAAEMEDPDSLQLALDASLSGENEEQFHDVGCERSSSLSSIVSNNSYYVDTVPAADEFESHQTQTQIVDQQDVETGTESEHELKKKKMMRFAMAVNSGIDIAPAEPKKKSVRIKGIMKMSRPGTPCSVPSTTSISSVVEDAIRERAIQERNRPQTCAQVGADYGFPSDISISGFIGNLVPSKWAVGADNPMKDNGTAPAKENVSHTHITFDEGDTARGFMGTAYDILSAGLRYASSLIGDEAELEPREDTIHYNGYKIKVFGRKLLLESVHVNCDFNIDSSNGSGAGSFWQFLETASLKSRTRFFGA
ncbi:hypothetical protein Ocin01_05773 [Orchesella cincta]|uniref:Uncharacterized protein n=1 Tax=Orchesella cincta TaxID=48709 RepID=A0A1D2N6P9_ORCCI|nr:hypothetical protein Ocin01_05773 [Orchesella cincta]